MKQLVKCLSNGGFGALQAIVKIVERLPNTFRIKSERINALRKRYEEFLEEDKKRKERNEFILGKLDKMRLCNGIVTHKCQTNYPEIIEKQTQSRTVTIHDGVSAHSTKFRSRSPQPKMEIALRNPNDSTLLKEIMNKFILIPKRDIIHETAIQEYLSEQRQTDQNNENTDWKSKYEILNQLKKNEKDSTHDEDIGANEHNFDRPEKDISYANVDYPLNNTWQAPIGTKQTKLHENQYASTPIPNSNSNEETNISSNIEEVKLNPTVEHLNVDYQEPVHQGAEIKNKDNEFNESPDRIEVGEVNDVEYNVAPAEDRNIPETAPSVDNTILNPVVDESEYPTDVINVADFTPSDDVVLQDGYNINPDSYGLNQTHFNNSAPVTQTSPTMVKSDGVEAESQENNAQQRTEYSKEFDTDATYNEGENEAEYTHEDETMNITHKQEIEAFETEQNEMFYQEAPSKNVELEGTEQMYNTQNQNDNSQNQYYYEPPLDQAYAEEINKHDDTIQLYDQNYAQQYVETPQLVFERTQQQENPQLQNYESSQFVQEPQYVQQSQEYAQQEYGEQQLYTEQQPEYTQEQIQQHYEQQGAYENQTAYGQQEQYEQQTLYEQQQAPYEQQAAHEQQPAAYTEQQDPEQQEPQIFASYTDPQELYAEQEKQEEAKDIQQISQQLDSEQGYNAKQS